MASVRHVRFYIAAVLLLVVFIASGVGLWRRSMRSSGDIRLPPEDIRLPLEDIRNVLLISIDTCRADYLSCYGYDGPTTPNIDGVAAEGTLFENVIAPVPLTLPAHSSMFTGMDPPSHGVHLNLGYQLSKSKLTLAEMLEAKGFTTGAIVSAAVLDASGGVDQGFDTYEDDFSGTDTAHGVPERKAGEATRRALEWLEKHKSKKNFFLFLHYYDPHSEYVPPEPFASRFADNPYAGEIAYTDHAIGQVLAKLKELSLYDSTLIIVTGDHGEMLGEHGEAEHGYFVYESAIKVPLIFKLPEAHKSQRINDLVGIIDIVPTVCSMLGITVPKDLQGQDLSGYFRGKTPDEVQRHLYCESMYPSEFEANSLLSLSSLRFKYIQTTRPELYDLIKDPSESSNLIEKEQHRSKVMQEMLAQLLEESVRMVPGSKTDIDVETIQRLQSLGYIGGSAPDADYSFDQSKPDPKDLIEFYGYWEHGISLREEDKHDEAIEVLTEAIKLNPKFAKAYHNRGSSYHRKAEYDLAIRDYSRAIELSPDFALSYSNRGKSYASKGDYEQALRDFAKAIELDPKEKTFYIDQGLAYLDTGDYDLAIRSLNKSIRLKPANFTYSKRGLAHMRKGNIGLAIRDFTTVIEADPNSDESYKYRGLTRLLEREYELAIRDLDQAIELNPRDAEGYAHRAVAHARRGDLDLAIRDFDQVIQLQPKHSEAYRNRGIAYSRQGEYGQGVRDLEQAIQLNPADVLAHKFMSETLKRLGRTKEALDYLRRAQALARPRD